MCGETEVHLPEQVAEKAFQWISPVYTWVFLAVRTGLGPPMAAWLAITLCSASGKIAPGYR